MTYRWLGRAVVSALLLSLLSTPPALALEAQVMIVLDGSGSMWGKIEGRTRIEVAREVIRDLMSDWDPEVELGLMAYGHRRKDDCADIETLVPVGAARPQAVVAAVDALQPKGMTPLSEAVRRAAAELKFTEKRATVVLVSDGLETCKQDPCTVGAELAKAGVAFTAHVIGFGVTSAEEAGLRCLAKNTGGMYLTAGSAAALRDALRRTVDQAKEEPQPVVEKPGPARVAPPATVTAGARFDVRWEGPNSRGDYLTVVRVGAPDSEFLDYAYTTVGSPLRLTAPDQPGAHEVRYVFGTTGAVLARAGMKVEAATASLAGPASIGAGGRISVGWNGPNNEGDYVTIVPAGAPDSEFLDYAYTSAGSPASFRVPDQAGAYELRYVTGGSQRVLARAAITVVAAGASVVGPATATAGQVLSIEWKGPDNEGDYVTIVRVGAPDNEFLNYAYTSGGSPASFQAPDEPGGYELRYVSGQSSRPLARAAITIVAAKASVSPPASVRVAQRFSVVWQGPNNPGDYVTIVAVGAPEGTYLSYADASGGSPAVLDAPEAAGSYEIRYVSGQSSKTLASAPISVRN